MNTLNQKLNWSKSNDGLIPAIIQDANTKQVLMLGYMNEASLTETIKTSKVTFFSRSRQSIWVKGESSGHFFHLVEIKPDCDQDALLILVNPAGPACHRNTETCFDSETSAYDFLQTLSNTIEERFQNPDPKQKSYTASLIQEGNDRIIQKVGEEAVETLIAAKNDDLSALEGEASDLVFHLMVLLRAKKTSLLNVVKKLQSRHHQ